MTEVLPFTFPDTGQQVRSLSLDGEAWFVGKDACEAVGISKYRDAIAQLDDDERVSMVVDTPGGPQTMALVNEPGVYALMMISRSPRVKPFRRWLAHEVVPALRRTGTYTVPVADPDPAPLRIQLAVNTLAELAHDEHVVPAAARILAFKRWRKPRKGIEAFVQLAIDVNLPGIGGASAQVRALPSKAAGSDG
jgi:prophage antirepressor-like protein